MVANPEGDPYEDAAEEAGVEPADTAVAWALDSGLVAAAETLLEGAIVAGAEEAGAEEARAEDGDAGAEGVAAVAAGGAEDAGLVSAAGAEEAGLLSPTGALSGCAAEAAVETPQDWAAGAPHDCAAGAALAWAGAAGAPHDC